MESVPLLSQAEMPQQEKRCTAQWTGKCATLRVSHDCPDNIDVVSPGSPDDDLHAENIRVLSGHCPRLLVLARGGVLWPIVVHTCAMVLQAAAARRISPLPDERY